MSLALAPLPYDILALIVSWAPRSTWTTLCLICRDFHRLAAPRLYRVADFRADEVETAYQFLKVISSSPNLGYFVRYLSVIEAPVAVVPVFLPALRNMPNLQHFCCKRLGSIILHVPSVLDAMASLPALSSLDTAYTDQYDWEGLLDRLPPLRSLAVDAPGHHELGALERLLLRSHDILQSLDTHSYWDLESFLQTRAQGVVWPCVTELRLDSLRSTAPAEAFPNLEALHVSERRTPASRAAAHILRDASVLPHLCKLSIVASPIP